MQISRFYGMYLSSQHYNIVCENYLDYHILDILAHGPKCLDIMGLDLLGLDLLGLDILGIICSLGLL